MEYNVYISSLYDIYNELLTDKQKDYFECYYFNNLTLAEISENYNISRNAVHKNIKETEEKLINYENILKIYEKNKKIKNVVDCLDEKTKKAILEIIE